jgi:hypothetical protein
LRRVLRFVGILWISWISSSGPLTLIKDFDESSERVVGVGQNPDVRRPGHIGGWENGPPPYNERYWDGDVY